MDRLFTKDATGVAPDGRWYAGDINALQDVVAALTDLTQALSVGTLAVGQSDLQILRYGALEARLTGSMRMDGIVRVLGGLVAGTFTTTQRDAIAPGSRPYGLVILNITTNQYEWNAGSDATPDWQAVGQTAAQINIFDLRDNRPTAGAAGAGGRFIASDMVAEWISDGSAWARIGEQAGGVTMTLAAAATAGKILLQGQAWPATSGIYADLFAILGGSNLPDMRRRVPAGYKSGDADFGALLATGGESAHVLTAAEFEHHHLLQSSGNQGSGASNGWLLSTQSNPTDGVHLDGPAGHNNLQPFIVVNFEAKL